MEDTVKPNPNLTLYLVYATQFACFVVLAAPSYRAAKARAAKLATLPTGTVRCEA
jgi:hypothetical protein